VYWIIGGQTGQLLSFAARLLSIGASLGTAMGLYLALDWDGENSEPDAVGDEHREVRGRIPGPRGKVGPFGKLRHTPPFFRAPRGRPALRGMSRRKTRGRNEY
jgi:hypothetical protein